MIPGRPGASPRSLVTRVPGHALRARAVNMSTEPPGQWRALAGGPGGRYRGRLYRLAQDVPAAGPLALLPARTRWERRGMRGSIQNALRLFTRVMRPLALRSAGKEGSSTAVVRHVGRRSGWTYETPVIAAQHGDSFLIALPYGERTDWLKNVLDKGSAAIVTNGHTYEVDRPQVIPMAEATTCFRPREQRMHRQFHVDSALRVHQRLEARR